MDLRWTGETPPPYTPQTETPDELIGHIQATVNHDSGNDSNPIEVERVRNFLLFCLATDYRFSTSVVLSASDHEHFFELNRLLGDLRVSYLKPDLTRGARISLAPYFWKYLYAPCKGLAIPVDHLVHTIIRFAKYSTVHGRYNGCCFGILHTKGTSWLAQKLWYDRSIIVPCILHHDTSALDGLISKTNAFGSNYYSRAPSSVTQLARSLLECRRYPLR
jgi:hypothetical protein